MPGARGKNITFVIWVREARRVGWVDVGQKVGFGLGGCGAEGWVRVGWMWGRRLG